jgi:hypothetical protein
MKNSFNLKPNLGFLISGIAFLIGGFVNSQWEWAIPGITLIVLYFAWNQNLK